MMYKKLKELLAIINCLWRQYNLPCSCIGFRIIIHEPKQYKKYCDQDTDIGDEGIL